MRHCLRPPIVFFTIVSAIASVAQAAPVSYMLDPAQSVLNVSGFLEGGGTPLAQQAPGSLSTSYSGIIQGDRGAGTIELLGGTLTAANSGSWAPAAFGVSGNAPANYGAQMNLGLAFASGAVRDLSFQTLSDPAPIVANQFPGPSIDILSGAIDYLITGLFSAAGQQAFTDVPYSSSGGSALLFADNVMEIIIIPIAVQVPVTTSGFTLIVNIDGNLVGARAVPEPATGLLLAGGALFAFRRKRFANSD